MSKVYLLLRNNKQTGPHSLEEIIQLGLKPHDLIWIEGRSAGWSYPSEIDALKPYAPITTANELREEKKTSTPTSQKISDKPVKSKKIFVSMPGKVAQSSVSSSFLQEDILETKAEALRKRSETYLPQTSAVISETTETKYARSLQEVEEEYTKWIYQNKSKNKNSNKKQLMAAAIVLLFLIIGWFGAQNLFFNKSNVTPQQLTVQPNLNTKDQNSAPAAEPENILQKEDEQPSYKNKYEEKAVLKNKELPVSKEQKAKISDNRTPEITAEVIAEPSKQDVAKASENNSVPATEVPAENKKTLKEKIGGIFKKLTKKDEAGSPEGTDNRNGERNAKKRNDAEVPAATAEVDLSDAVEVKMVNNSEGWMMGVKGLKLTLHNRSNATLKKAAVEVLYYSEHKTLLEKKTVYFSNIGAKRTQTLAAPEHRLADHAEVKLISAIGVEDGYASNN